MNKINLSSVEEIKTRNWAFLIYPESLEELPAIKQYLINTGAECCISPFHCQDEITSADYDLHTEHYKKLGLKVGDKKKPHFHVIVCCPGSTTFKHIKNVFVTPLNGFLPTPLVSVSGYYHYLWHDHSYGHTQKHEYKSSDIWRCGGFDINNYVDLSQTQTARVRDFIVDLIRLNDITCFSDVEDLLSALNMPMERRVLFSCRQYIKDYIVSRKWRKNNGDHKLMYYVPMEGGEVVPHIFEPSVFGIHDDKEIGLNA